MGGVSLHPAHLNFKYLQLVNSSLKLSLYGIALSTPKNIMLWNKELKIHVAINKKTK